MNRIAEAIDSLELMSSELEKFANRHETYNTDYALYLEHLSWEMTKHANELREIDFVYGGF